MIVAVPVGLPDLVQASVKPSESKDAMLAFCWSDAPENRNTEKLSALFINPLESWYVQGESDASSVPQLAAVLLATPAKNITCLGVNPAPV